MSDPALQTLVYPIRSGEFEIAPGTRVLLIRGRVDPVLTDLGRFDLTIEQSFAPDRDALERSGQLVVAEATDTGYDCVLVLTSRQRQEARAQLARAVTLTRPGGVVAAAAPNAEGGKTMAADFAALLNGTDGLSKNKCRVVWAKVEAGGTGETLLHEWLALDAPRPVLDGTFVSRPGLFAWDRIDPGSKLLAEHVPATLSGKGADLGAGFGYLSRQVLERAAKVAAMDLYEAEKRALDLAEQNLQVFNDRRQLTGIWSDVTKGIDGPYDFIVSNPPFHQSGRAGRTDIGIQFIEAAAKGLRGGGVFYLVANRHLPYERTLNEVFAEVDVLADEGGYKVVRAVKASGKHKGR